MAPPARLAAAGTAFVAAALALALAVPSASAAGAGAADPLGFTLGKPKRRAAAPRAPAAAAKEDPKTACPQAAGDPSTPILPPGAVLQFPARVLPRSLALGARRRAVLVTDGASYMSAGAPFPFNLLMPRELPVPHAYIVSGNGSVLFDMEFKGRMALPYGIAEDPKARTCGSSRRDGWGAGKGRAVSSVGALPRRMRDGAFRARVSVRAHAVSLFYARPFVCLTHSHFPPT